MRVTVVGAGVVGLAVADALARRGADVRVLEAATPMSARSLGGSRIFRLAHGDAALVEAARRSRPLWAAWSARAGRALVGDEGAVVSGAQRVEQWAAAMDAAGVAHHVGDDPGTLPGPVGGPVLHDPAGGMIDVRGVGDLLRAAVPVATATVRAVHVDGTVVTDDAAQRADAVVVTAGAGTPDLARPLGVEVPDRLVHHVRLSFPLRAPGTPPCWLDGAGGHGMSSTYQHRTPEGWWAVGGHLPDQECALERGVDEVTARWRAVLPAYAAQHLPGVHPEPVEEIACTPAAGSGDGVHTARVGAVHLSWGDNLFKLAPLLGEELADAVVTDRVAHAIGAGADAADHRR